MCPQIVSFQQSLFYQNTIPVKTYNQITLAETISPYNYVTAIGSNEGEYIMHIFFM